MQQRIFLYPVSALGTYLRTYWETEAQTGRRQPGHGRIMPFPKIGCQSSKTEAPGSARGYRAKRLIICDRIRFVLATISADAQSWLPLRRACDGPLPCLPRDTKLPLLHRIRQALLDIHSPRRNQYLAEIQRRSVPFNLLGHWRKGYVYPLVQTAAAQEIGDRWARFMRIKQPNIPSRSWPRAHLSGYPHRWAKSPRTTPPRPDRARRQSRSGRDGQICETADSATAWHRARRASLAGPSRRRD